MRYIKTEGIVIKRRNYNEADRVLTIFTKDLGKISVKAKGVRRITSRRSSHIELLNHSRISLYKAHSIPVLTEIEPLSDFEDIKNDLTKVGFAYHICELIDGLCPENQELGGVFNLLCSTLHNLSSCHSGEPLSTIDIGSSESNINISGFVIPNDNVSTEGNQSEKSLSGNSDYSTEISPRQLRPKASDRGFSPRAHQPPAVTGRDDKNTDILSIIHGFEVELLTLLGYWNKKELSHALNTYSFIENILERRLRSQKIFSKIS